MAKDNVVKFKGMYLRSVHLSLPEGADPTITIQCTAEFDDAIKERMAWFDLDASVLKASLRGEIAGEVLELVPAQHEMKSKAITINIKNVNSFELVVTKDKEGEAGDVELRFAVECRQKGALALLEKYVGSMGRGRAVGKISYPMQLGIPGTEKPAKEPKQATLPETAE